MRCSISSTRAESVASAVVRQHRHRALRDDRTGIDFRHHEMHGRAVLRHAGRRARACVCSPWKAGSSDGWMLSSRPVPARHEPRRQHPHEAGEADDVDALPFERGLERALEGLAVLAENGV